MLGYYQLPAPKFSSAEIRRGTQLRVSLNTEKAGAGPSVFQIRGVKIVLYTWIERFSASILSSTQ